MYCIFLYKHVLIINVQEDFIMAYPQAKAEDVLLDQALLECPLPATDRLRRLLKTKAP